MINVCVQCFAEPLKHVGEVISKSFFKWYLDHCKKM